MGETFGKRLKQIRKNKKLTQKQLANKIGISEMSVTYYETNRSCPSIAVLEWLCTALEVSATELLGY